MTGLPLEATRGSEMDARPQPRTDPRSLLLEKFGELVEAPGGVHRARELVLGLALCGDLARTNATTHDASAAWQHVRLGDVADCVLGKMLDKAKHRKGTARPYLRNVNVRWGSVDLSDLREMFFEDDELDRYAARNGDVLVCEGGEPGRATVWRSSEPILLQKAIHRVRPRAQVLGEWIVLNLRYDTWNGRLAALFTGATIKHLTGKALAGYEIPLPPLEEQKRIVAKVDQLMALCDDLEARQTKQRELGTRLTKSALDALTTAETPESFDLAWKRIGENFGTLVDRADKVDVLRRTVLELAVRGRLAPRIAQQSVTALEARIATERAAMIGGRRRGGRGNRAGEAEMPPQEPYAIPETWRWKTLAEVAGHIVDGTHHTPRYVQRGMDFISAKDVRNGRISFEGCKQISKEEFDELTQRCSPKRGDVLVTKSGSIGEVAIVDTDQPFTLFESVALVPIVPSVNSTFASYVVYLGASGDFGAENRRGVAVKHLHLVDLRRLPFPLPPRSEQDAIVAEVEALMSFCDALQASLARSEASASRLVEAVVRNLVA